MAMRTVQCSSNDQTWIVRYEEGLEDEAVEQIMLLADDRMSAFDWTDAANLCCQITTLAAEECSDRLSADHITNE